MFKRLTEHLIIGLIREKLSSLVQNINLMFTKT